ncbi:MAG: hypothetical protein ABFS46_06835, partial [Myxococcota bacterium]
MDSSPRCWPPSRPRDAVGDAAVAGPRAGGARRDADRVGARLRKKGKAGRTITARVRYADFTDVTRAHTMATPSASSAVLFRVGRRLVEDVRADEPERGVRLLGIS